jgi:hypothetical protein
VQGGLFTYIVENLIFAQGAGEHRLDIYYYGTLEVLRHPLFGIGLNDWARPFWRPHPTIDSYWLMTAMRHGIPAVLLLVLGILLEMLRISTAPGLDEDARHYRSGYLIALCGVILTLSTVHIWGPITVYVMAYLGAGAWFFVGDHRPRQADLARLPRTREVARPGQESPAGDQETIVRPHTVGYEKGPGRRQVSKAVESGTAGHGARGAGRTATGPGPRKRV